MATLNTHVGVHHPEHGSVLLAPGVDVPEWAIPLIDNPDVWADAPAEGIATESEDESDDESAGEDELEDEDVESESEGEEPDEAEDVTIPAKAGPKATAEAWSAYAKAKGFEIEGDASRKDIIEALEAEGIATE